MAGSVHIKTRKVKTKHSVTRRYERYYCYYRRGGAGFRTIYAGAFARRKDAETRAAIIMGELAAGRDPAVLLASFDAPAAAKVTLEAAWLAFEAARVDVGEKAQSLYRNSRERWLLILGKDTDPATVRPDDVIDGIVQLVGGDDDRPALAPGTVRVYTSALSQVLDHAEVQPNPVKSPKVKLPQRSKKERAIPNQTTWSAIVAQLKKRSKLPARLQEACGLRVAEVAGLEWRDIDFVHGQLRVRREATKTRAGRRWIPVPPELLDETDRLLAVEDRDGERRVFTVTANELAWDLRRACVLAGVPAIGTHALRHRRISLWLRHGIDSVQVARWSGHSKPSESTDTYGHTLVDAHLDEWRDFWLACYRSPGGAPVRHGGVVA